MANIRIKDLPNTLAQMGDNDIIAVEDTASNETKKITKAGIKQSIGKATAAADGLMAKEDKEKHDKMSANFNSAGKLIPYLRKNIYAIKNLGATQLTFTPTSGGDILAWTGSLYIIMPSGHYYSVAAGQITVPNNHMVYLSSNSAQFQALDETITDDRVAYLLAGAFTSAVRDQEGFIMLGHNDDGRWTPVLPGADAFHAGGTLSQNADRREVIPANAVITSMLNDAAVTPPKMSNESNPSFIKRGFLIAGHKELNSWTLTSGNTGTFTFGKNYIFPAKGNGNYYELQAGSVANIASYEGLYISKTTPAFTALDEDTLATSPRVYLIKANLGTLVKDVEGLVCIGYNCEGTWVSFFDSFYVQPSGSITPSMLASSIAAVETSLYNNVGVNASSIQKALKKYKTKSGLTNNMFTILCWGDSIFGAAAGENVSAVSGTNQMPAGEINSVPYQLWSELKYAGQDLLYYPRANSAWTFNGTWANYDSENKQYKNSSVQNDYAEITITGASKAALVFMQMAGLGTMSVTINGSAPSSLGFGSDTIDCSKANPNGYDTREVFFQRALYSGMNPAQAYTFRFTITSTAKNVYIASFEKWNGDSLRVINMGRAGNTSTQLKSGLYNDALIETYNPDLIIFEFPLLNDVTYTVGDTTFSNLNDLLDRINKSGIPVLSIIPHQRAVPDAGYDDYLYRGRLAAMSNGIGCIDMAERMKNLNRNTYTYDGTHLNDAGITVYKDEIIKLFKIPPALGAGLSTDKICQSGVNAQCGQAITFDQHFLQVPKIEITPVYYDNLAPQFMYVSNVSRTGFTVTGTGFFNWKAYL